MRKLITLLWFSLTDRPSRELVTALLYGEIAIRHATHTARNRYLARVDTINAKELVARRRAAGLSDSGKPLESEKQAAA